MENKATSELRNRKASIRSKLLASVSMLLVATIMLSSATYAWFVLSTAPEVKGMSTTVGANGSLEIALLNDSTDTAAITAGIGDSVAATQDVTKSNITWGNIVDLGDASYGLGDVTLYPSALDLSEGNAKVANLYSPLKTPSYGVDGRIADLVANTVAGKYDTTTGLFAGNAANYGVRGVGTATDADPVAAALARAQSSYRSELNAAQAAAKNSLKNENAAAVSIMLLAHAADLKEGLPFQLKVESVAVLGDVLNTLETAAGHMETAIKWAIAAKLTAEGTTTGDIAGIDLAAYASDTNFSAPIAALNTLKTNIAASKAAFENIPAKGAGEFYQWTEYEAVLKAIMNTDSLTIEDKKLGDLSGLSSEDLMAWAGAVMTGSPKIVVYDGLLSDMADMVNTFVSAPFDITITGFTARNATITVQKHANPAEAYMITLGEYVAALTAPDGSGSALPIINTKYGYIVDLAVRSSADTNLLLSGKAARVAGSDDANLQGGGSIFTLTSGDIKDLAALRVVFVDTNDYTILGVAGLSSTPADGTTDTYALKMYDYEVTAAGGIELKTEKTEQVVTALTANNAKCISALVYLDGNYVDSAMDAAAGTLNLQFASSTALTPMEYTNYMTELPSESTEP